MAVKAKFKINHHATNDYGDGKVTTVHAFPVNGPGNEEWAAASPGGKLELTVANQAALAQLKPGAEFLLTFEHAPCSRIIPGAPMCEQMSGHDGPCGKTA